MHIHDEYTFDMRLIRTSMNLTVAMKIIGGFSTLFILLIITSTISFMNLSTIDKSLVQQNQLAIPTLKGSNELANKLLEKTNVTLLAFYQTDLNELNRLKENYNNINTIFMVEKKKLTNTIKNETKLLTNLQKVNSIHNDLSQNVEGVFNNREKTITLTAKLNSEIEKIEELADDAATLMLDLADHELAEDELEKAVSLGEDIESYFNSIVNLSLEYQETSTLQNAKYVETDLSTNLLSTKSLIKILVYELSQYNAEDTEDIPDDLQNAMNNIEELINGIKGLKSRQLIAFSSAIESLNAAESNVTAANKILGAQVKLANEATIKASESVNNAVSSGTSQTWFILVISAIIAFGIGFITLRSITRPLANVNEMLNIVASGDLSHKLDESGKDEFALLSSNCNKVIDSLRDLIQGIVSRSVQLAAAAEETSNITAQSTSSIEQQRSQVEQAASATTEMSSTSQSVLASVNDALGEIKQADNEAERVKVISEKTKETIEVLANEVDAAAHVIHQLQEDSSSIGTILDVIRGIADQTNLLALNAAIEAARAGEQGRGFSVVADEVRTLASRTQESTQEIQKMIEVLQLGAEKAVSVMDNGKAQAANCVEQSELANKALDTITHAVHEAYDRSSQIATAAGEQSVVAHEISHNLESIVAIAEETTLGAKQTADASSEVARLSEELQNSVQEFKL